MKNKILAGGVLLLMLTGASLAVAGDVVGPMGPLGSLKLDKPSKTTSAEDSVPAPARAVVAPTQEPAQQTATTTIGMPAAKPAPALAKKPATPVASTVPPVASVKAAAPQKPITSIPASAKTVASSAQATKAAAPAPASIEVAPKEVAPTPPPPVSVSAPLQAPLVSATPRRVKPVQLSEREIAYQEQEADLARQIRIVQMQVTLRDLQKKLLDNDTSAADSVVLPPPPPVQSVLDVPEEPVVRLISVWGDPSRLSADVLANGVRTSVKAGDPLPEGWRVVEVGRNSLLIQRGRQKTLVKIGG